MPSAVVTACSGGNSRVSGSGESIDRSGDGIESIAASTSEGVGESSVIPRGIAGELPKDLQAGEQLDKSVSAFLTVPRCGVGHPRSISGASNVERLVLKYERDEQRGGVLKRNGEAQPVSAFLHPARVGDFAAHMLASSTQIQADLDGMERSVSVRQACRGAERGTA